MRGVLVVCVVALVAVFASITVLTSGSAAGTPEYTVVSLGTMGGVR
jgi:hypothetical protein